MVIPHRVRGRPLPPHRHAALRANPRGAPICEPLNTFATCFCFVSAPTEGWDPPQAQAASAMPAFVPWLHGSARQKLFVCDVMLEGLARQMRLFGLDVLSMQQRDKRHRSAVVRCALSARPRTRALMSAYSSQRPSAPPGRSSNLSSLTRVVRLIPSASACAGACWPWAPRSSASC